MSQELSLPENPTPQDFGFPEKPTAQDRQCWANQERFLAEYVNHDGHPCIAAKAAGLTYQAYARWRDLNHFNFNKRLAEANAQVDDSLHAEIIRRGRDGVDHPIVYKGEITGWYKQYSDNLLMFEYKARHPEFRDNHQVNVDSRTYVTQITINPPSTDSSTSNVIDAQPQPQLDSTDSATDTDS